MALIDAMLTTANPISGEARNVSRRVAVQVIASDRFEAVIEGSFMEDGQPVEWTRIIPFTNATTLSNDDRLNLNPLCAYRARLMSGGPARVILG